MQVLPGIEYVDDTAPAHASLREKLAHGDVILKGADAQVRTLLATLS